CRPEQLNRATDLSLRRSLAADREQSPVSGHRVASMLLVQKQSWTMRPAAVWMLTLALSLALQLLASAALANHSSGEHSVVFNHVYNINVPMESLCSVDLESSSA
ncbi:hypothetical protein CRUP_018604, partial [Coryphaenoides rupestris]